MEGYKDSGRRQKYRDFATLYSDKLLNDEAPQDETEGISNEDAISIVRQISAGKSPVKGLDMADSLSVPEGSPIFPFFYSEEFLDCLFSEFSSAQPQDNFTYEALIRILLQISYQIKQETEASVFIFLMKPILNLFGSSFGQTEEIRFCLPIVMKICCNFCIISPKIRNSLISYGLPAFIIRYFTRNSDDLSIRVGIRVIRNLFRFKFDDIIADISGIVPIIASRVNDPIHEHQILALKAAILLTMNPNGFILSINSSVHMSVYRASFGADTDTAYFVYEAACIFAERGYCRLFLCDHFLSTLGDFIQFNGSADISTALNLVRILCQKNSEKVSKSNLMPFVIQDAESGIFSVRYEAVFAVATYITNSCGMMKDVAASNGGLDAILSSIDSIDGEAAEESSRAMISLIDLNPNLYLPLCSIPSVAEFCRSMLSITDSGAAKALLEMIEGRKRANDTSV